ncbi:MULTISPECIES: imidazole glycerol phosphate synthase subunit HisH [unclassified Imperialibacter]|uniref:imidazole glycerol phosphate synthase subunit HisH n=1 Tax=unclassified Imperialibacter TaxID=2629706 RepID=UPI0012563E0D|nr:MULTISPECIES: imidazole glycerol phosphate synthase subunit HisH [unclassified Imperialibacter]CAD5250787.1 imidazole glycerol phosphate synthase, glutamine amidotransferase subunit with HisF [Imperialibacter sp. 75]CAD5285760.1 imidazole glycerol phosphate synthase, glutamine amidotransferase subunit with HisF [Imperialibacter sp. 89]VVT04956.1 imidazole glycerol phosphate synthase, glutamine amidotransferase subunit with HisF [Imperialibacter sp. EC-SDR9]
MKVAIIKYNAGNVQSVTFALNRLGIEPVLSNDPEVLKSADKVIFPGVGEASTAMASVKENGLDKIIPGLKQPFLGICLGLQLMCRHSEENNTACLGVFDLEVKKFPPNEKVPHMGWNKIHSLKGPLMNGLTNDAYLYFVHSYYAEMGSSTIARSDYMVPFSAALQKGNFYAVQAHPEKSGVDGARILKNFIEL